MKNDHIFYTLGLLYTKAVAFDQVKSNRL